MIDLPKEVIEVRISTDYKKVLNLIEKEKLAMAHILGRKIVKNRLNWWPLKSFETGKDLAQTWGKYFEENFKIR
jgi:hypothetical protein